MNEPQIINTLMQQFGFAGLLLFAVYIIARKLASQYEMRISALETASARCEADRIEMRNLIITGQQQHITELTAKLNQPHTEA